jgi:uncharacterized protein
LGNTDFEGHEKRITPNAGKKRNSRPKLCSRTHFKRYSIPFFTESNRRAVTEKDYVIRVLTSPASIDAAAWNALLAAQNPAEAPNPFMRHEYLAAMHDSKSANPKSGWTPRFITLWQGDKLAGACALYLKTHSYGEYVFDWAWANAYAEHGLPYYPKALIAPPFTPVPGARLMAGNADERLLLVRAVMAWCDEEKLSSLHLLFASDDDVAACEQAGLLMRHNVQFHWSNTGAPTLPASRGSLPPEGAELARGGPSLRSIAPTLPASRSALPPEGALRLRPGKAGSAAPAGNDEALITATLPASLPLPPGEGGGEGSPHPAGFRDFDDFLMSLTQEKRKKIRQERRKVREAGIEFRWALGADITDADWDFFYRCYERTYYEHGNAPYLTRDFFRRMQRSMPENWLLFVAEQRAANGALEPVATSLIAVSALIAWAGGQNGTQNGAAEPAARVAYGRYWGALARVDCLHFEACYYQPIEWCIAHGFARFEGGAQGEHKMARALLPVKTTSAHWLAHPSFADAVERFLEREGAGIDGYLNELEKRSPLRQVDAPGV